MQIRVKEHLYLPVILFFFFNKYSSPHRKGNKHFDTCIFHLNVLMCAPDNSREVLRNNIGMHSGGSSIMLCFNSIFLFSPCAVCLIISLEVLYPEDNVLSLDLRELSAE